MSSEQGVDDSNTWHSLAVTMQFGVCAASDSLRLSFPYCPHFLIESTTYSLAACVMGISRILR